MQEDKKTGTDSSLGATISILVPMFNASRFLPRTLSPLIEMRDKGDVLEIIVIDDCSTDSSASIAADLGVSVVSMARRSGPGAARNLGALQARGELLWFVDSDVIVNLDGAAMIRTAFEDPAVVAVFGSYDDAPPEKNFASQYKNLTHHYYHQNGQREASTFWAGCGAVRRSDFLRVGGFDAARYPTPSIEDVELGYRLRARGGRILLLHQLQGTHLKRWTIPDVVFTDICRRAVPWARLVLAGVGSTNDLNVAKAERFRAVVADLLFVSCIGALLEPSFSWVPVALAATVVGANWNFLMFMRRCGGATFAFSALLLHQVYYVYSSVIFFWCWVEASARRATDPVVTTRGDLNGGSN